MDSQIERQYKQMHPALQLAIFILLFVGVYILGNIIGLGVTMAMYGINAVMDVAQLKLDSPNAANILWILQTTGTTFPIFAAPVFFAFVIVRNPQDYLKPTFRFSWILLILVFAIMLISNPVIEFLSNLNEKMVLPSWLKWMRENEDNVEKLMNVMLSMKTIWSLVFNVLFVGLLTAVVEEFMFRGVLQTIFVRLTKNTHAAIWITAILFSAFHMEFFGFLPRLMLGVLFGYFVAWSGSVWPAVWAHFLNNATAVVATYLFQHRIIKADPDNQHMFTASGYIISFTIMLFLLFVYRRTASGKKQTPAY
jgi:membrane protease YdiL (CAAX protease family)